MMTDAEKIDALVELLDTVISALDMTKYEIEDTFEAANVIREADKYHQQMLDILNDKKMTEIEKVKAEIKVLEKKVALLEEIERIEKKKETQNLTDLIYDWWDDVFTTNSDWDMEASIDDLVTRIEEWLPKEQSAAGSQNAYVECTVEGFNDCLNKIKRKLR
jgi:hypothetical protein